MTAVKDLGDLRRYAEEHGWVVTEEGQRLIWKPPDPAQPIVRSPNRANYGHSIDNISTELRRSGLPDPRKPTPRRPRARRAAAPATAPAIAPEEVAIAMSRTPRNGTATLDPAPPAEAPPAQEPRATFAASLADLVEEEFLRRAGDLSRQNDELTRQNEGLREEIVDLRARLAAAQAIEDRLRTEARAEMEAALERVLSGARLR